MTQQESEWAAEMIAQAKRDHETILALRKMLDKVRDELKRYTDVYGDPDAPVNAASFGVGEPDVRPLTGIAAAAQLRGEEPPSWEDALKHPSDEEVA